MTRFAASLFILLVLVFHSALGGEIKVVENGHGRIAQSVHKVSVRKLMQEVSLDYDYGGPNPRHDPRKGKPPGGPSRSL